MASFCGIVFKPAQGMIAFLTLCALGSCGVDAAEPEARPAEFATEQIEFFEQQVRPLLQKHCLKCHGGEEKIRGGLKLTDRDALIQGGDSGPALSLEKPESSLLLSAINYDGFEMPPSGKLPANEIEILTRWVEQRAPWKPGDRLVEHAGETPSAKKPAPTLDEGRRHWAFQPIQSPSIPQVQQSDWIRNPVDAYLLHSLEQAGIRPAADADPVALLRRVYFDLIGLPPSPAAVDQFLQDHSPAAYERVVEDLLESPQYGEKWGRHWLDLVRFAESNGYERDGIKPFAWRYRDYVIQSFNEDKPYDQFIREQIAGDELPGFRPEAIVATGYYRLGLWDDEPVDALQARYDELDDILSTTSQVFLGLTMNCARCHDHKLDPLPQTDYYRLLAFFQDIQRFSDTRDVSSRFNLTDISPPEVRARYEEELQQREARLAELTQTMEAIEQDAIRKMPAADQRATEGPERQSVLEKKLKDFLTPEQSVQYTRLREKRQQLKKSPEPARELALSVNHCETSPPPTHVLIRGNSGSPGAQVEPGFPAVLGLPDPQLPAVADGAKSSGRRSVLADWIASKSNPLTARVMMNRVWQYHFGRGLVRSSSNFGFAGDAPTHPELLDWLASQFMQGEWKLKPIHQLIVLSHSYQQDSRGRAEASSKDPENHLLWRFPPRRLTAEEVRDAILAVSGQLNLKAGGPSIYPRIPPEVLAGQSRPGENWGQSPPAEANRRSVYVSVKRSLLVPILATHDMADTDSSCPIRYTTTVPTQALGMLNGEFINSQAVAMAKRLAQEHPEGLESQIRQAIRLTAGRHPSSDEINRDLTFVKDLQSRYQLDDLRALTTYCLLMLNTNEFTYLD